MTEHPSKLQPYLSLITGRTSFQTMNRSKKKHFMLCIGAEWWKKSSTLDWVNVSNQLIKFHVKTRYTFTPCDTQSFIKMQMKTEGYLLLVLRPCQRLIANAFLRVIFDKWTLTKKLAWETYGNFVTRKWAVCRDGDDSFAVTMPKKVMFTY